MYAFKIGWQVTSGTYIGTAASGVIETFVGNGSDRLKAVVQVPFTSIVGYAAAKMALEIYDFSILNGNH
jgi:hypothetical protein